MIDPVLEAKDLDKVFRETGQELTILQGASLRILPGELVAVLGVSGSGKSTLLSILGTLDQPDAGVVTIGGRDPSTMSDTQLSRLRATMLGFVFQFHHLLPDLSARENIALPCRIAGMPKRLALERADELLEAIGLIDRADHRPAELSGGERQRTALARALANSPAVVLADEPTGSLDPANAGRLMEMLQNLSERFSQAFLVATHDERLARWAHRRLRLQDGLLVDVP